MLRARDESSLPHPPRRWYPAAASRAVLAPAAFGALVALASLAATHGTAQELPFTNFTPENQLVPLPSASVQSVYQDRQGFIWLGFFSSGLARYDGHSLEQYGMADGLPDPTVREIAEDGSGRLWIGTESGLAVSDRPLGEYPPGERVSFLTRVGRVELVTSRVRKNWLSTLPGGTVCAATSLHGIVCYESSAGGELQAGVIDVSRLWSEQPSPVSAIGARDDGSLWVSLEDGSVGLVAPGAAKAAPLLPTTSSPCWITAFLDAPDGSMLFGCDDGAVGRFDPRREGTPFEILDRNLGDPVHALTVTSRDELWAGSLGSGVVHRPLDGGRQSDHLTRRNGLPSESVWCITQDTEGNIWISHNGGLSRLRSDFRAFTQYTGFSRAGEVPLLPEPTVFTVAAPTPEDPWIWLGTGGGLVALDPRGVSRTIATTEGLTNNSVYSLLRDDAGRIWAGTLGGLNVISRGTSLPRSLDAAHEARTIAILGRRHRIMAYEVGTIYACRALPMPLTEGSEDSVESVWACGTEGASCWVDGRWYRFDPRSGLPAAGTTTAAYDSEGHLWLGSQASGIYRTVEPLTLARLRRIAGDAPPGVPVEVASRIFAPYWDRLHGARSENVHNLAWAGGRMWAATSAGLAAIRGLPATTLTLLDETNGLGGGRVVGLAYDRESGTLWAAQNHGLAQVRASTGEVLRRVSKQDGLVDNEVWVPSSLALGADGEVYMATPTGLSVYRPRLDESNRRPPRLRLRGADFSEDLTGHNEIVLSYAALSFANEQEVRYRTRLVGYDTTWSGDTAETKIRYTNLPAFFLPRGYVFEVVAANNDGVWSREPLRYGFTVQPPWWSRWWAVLAYLAVVGLMLVAFDSIRTLQLVRRTRELEVTVAARTAEIRAHAHEMETLDEIVASINRKLGFDEVVQAVLEQGLILIQGAHRGVLMLRDRADGSYRVTAETGFDQQDILHAELAEAELTAVVERLERLADGLSNGHVLSRNTDSPRVDEIFHPGPAMVVDLGTEEGLGGLLVFTPGPARSDLSDGEIQTLQRYRQHAILALDKARVVWALEVKSREAAQASHAKSAFLAAMSHELRTPLNSIIGFSEVLLAKTDEDEDPRSARFLGNIVASGKQLLSLINDILDLSKVEAGRMALDVEKVYVSELVEGVCRIMSAVADRRDIRLVQKVAPDLSTIVVDGSKVRQILYNLVSNAVKFSHDGGDVVISARAADPGGSGLGVPGVELAVVDHGIGIDPDDLERIFDEFHQLDSGTSRRFVGSGLGLALVRRFVELHGGRVTVSSTPGVGSTFRVFLPAAVPSASSTALR